MASIFTGRLMVGVLAVRSPWVLAILAGLASNARASEVITLEPSSAWSLNYANQSCRLMSVFGHGKNESVMLIEQFEPGERFAMTLAGRPFSFARRLQNRISEGQVVKENAPISLRFGANKAFKRTAMIGTLGKWAPALIFRNKLAISPENFDYDKGGTVPPYSMHYTREEEAAVDRLSLGYDGDDRVVLVTGSMGDAFSALDDCTERLVSSWGLDPQRVRSQRSPPTALNEGEWLTDADYPRNAIKGLQEGLLYVRVIVDKEGIATSCAIQSGASIEQFRELVCDAIIKRARFDPAIDADGSPFASYHTSLVLFKLSD
ncbi:energy transducer TonB [Qipengyuania sp.]|uniref:energy transducer TonB n=1 Tax=Qipengyuania sp. TaxID=2004515 RepID=UPI0035C7BBA4